MKEFEIHYISSEFSGLAGGMGIGRTEEEAVANFLDAHGSECKEIKEVLFYKNRPAGVRAQN